MPQCRRCRREVEPGAAVCGYCELKDPLAESAGPAQATPKQRRMLIGAILGAFVIVGCGAGAVWYRYSQPTAPSCDAPGVTSGISDLIHENAVHELTPTEAARFPAAAFSKLTNVETIDGNAHAAKRVCSAIVLLVLDERALAATEKIVAMRQVPRGAGELLLKSWHASERRLEVPVKWDLAPAPGGGDSPWDLSIDEASVAGIRDAVVLIARASAAQ